jgi:hypothetical protein
VGDLALQMRHQAADVECRALALLPRLEPTKIVPKFGWYVL